MADDELAAHTPSPEYMTQSVKRRVLELLGAESGLVNALAPLPYKSKYPLAPKLIDAAITMQIDPIVKPLSLRGKLDKRPALKKLAGELADKGFFRKYPGGGIGIGGGGGSEGEGSAGPGAAGDAGGYAGGMGPGGEPAGADTDPAGASSSTLGEGLGPEGLPDAPTGANLSAAARASSPTLGNLSSGFLSALGLGPNPSASKVSAAVSTALSALGLIGAPSMPGAGLAVGTAVGTANAQATALAENLGISQAEAMAALGAMAEAVAASDAATGLSSGQSGGAEQGEMTATADIPFAAMPTAGRPTISPATRANAAARAGGGISEDFLAALESLRGAA